MKQCFLFFLFTACSFGHQMPVHIDHAHALSEQFYRTYRAENQLAQDGSGGGCVDGVATVAGSFISYRKVNVDQARRLFVRGVEMWCAIFNQNLAIRPYLRNFPFIYSNVDLMLSFEDPVSGQNISPPYVSLIYFDRDKIAYRYFDKLSGSYFHCHEEPYVEALRIVQEEREREKH